MTDNSSASILPFPTSRFRSHCTPRAATLRDSRKLRSRAGMSSPGDGDRGSGRSKRAARNGDGPVPSRYHLLAASTAHQQLAAIAIVPTTSRGWWLSGWIALDAAVATFRTLPGVARLGKRLPDPPAPCCLPRCAARLLAGRALTGGPPTVPYYREPPRCRTSGATITHDTLCTDSCSLTLMPHRPGLDPRDAQWGPHPVI